MKKLFLCLLATMFFGFSGNAQNATKAKSELYKVSMVSIVDNARQYFKEGMTFKQFSDNLGANRQLTKEENVIVNEVYNYLSKKVDTGTIYQGYDGTSLINYSKVPRASSAPVTAKCGFWCWVQLIGDLLQIIKEALAD